MKRIKHIAMIAHDMGLIFEFLGIISLLPLLVLVIFREWNLVSQESVPLMFIVLGFAISYVLTKIWNFHCLSRIMSSDCRRTPGPGSA